MSDRATAPAAERNKAPILEILRRVLPKTGLVLEIASGTGQHVVHFARSLPQLEWQLSDPDPEARASIAGWIAHEGLANIRPALDLDVGSEKWPVEYADVMLCINMAHISSWEATVALIAGAALTLPRGGPLVVYGPFRRSGRETATSNDSFDADLRRRNPAWGLRDLEAW